MSEEFLSLFITVRDGMYYFYEPMYLTEVLPPDGYTTQYGWRPKQD